MELWFQLRTLGLHFFVPDAFFVQSDLKEKGKGCGTATDSTNGKLKIMGYKTYV